MSNDRLLVLAGAVALLAAAAPAHAATTELVSVNTAGQEGNGNSFDPSLSGEKGFGSTPTHSFAQPQVRLRPVRPAYR